MTPFTIDQLEALLKAATTYGRRARVSLRNSERLEHVGFKDAAKYLNALYLESFFPFKQFVDIALSGLPEDFVRETDQKSSGPEGKPFITEVYDLEAPPLLILDRFREFLASRSQAVDVAAVVVVPAVHGVVLEQPALDQPGFVKPGYTKGSEPIVETFGDQRLVLRPIE